MTREAVIVDCARSAFGKRKGALSGWHPTDLLGLVLRTMIERNDLDPALIDDVWIYGSSPENIYATIVQGRPNGMPSFGGHIPDEQVWQLAAYVRSMSGLVPVDAAPSRDDALQSAPSENRREAQPPVRAAVPPSSQQSK